MLQYIGLIHKDPGSDYGVSFPDFPGLITAGKDLDDARAMAEEALAFHVEALVQDGEAIPDPSSLETIMTGPENRDGVAILVAVNSDAQKTVRVNITLAADVLAQIDKFAESHGYTRSGFLAQAAKRVIEDEEQAA
jgi:predicted RNase H-like HicB family nuclease